MRVHIENPLPGMLPWAGLRRAERYVRTGRAEVVDTLTIRLNLAHPAFQARREQAAASIVGYDDVDRPMTAREMKAIPIRSLPPTIATRAKQDALIWKQQPAAAGTGQRGTSPMMDVGKRVDIGGIITYLETGRIDHATSAERQRELVARINGTLEKVKIERALTSEKHNEHRKED